VYAARKEGIRDGTTAGALLDQTSDTMAIENYIQRCWKPTTREFAAALEPGAPLQSI
jgi:alkyl hydroperoxide reductase subunit AhpF